MKIRKMKTKRIWYRVIVTEDEEKDFLRAMEDLALIYDKDFVEIIYEDVFEEEE